MLKEFLVCLVITAVSVNSQGFGIFGFGNIGGGIFSALNATVGIGINTGLFGRGISLQNTVLQSASNILSSQNVPEDLQVRLADTLAKAQEAFRGCEQSIFWQYRKCTTSELKKAMSAMKSIADEAKERQLASTTLASPLTIPLENQPESTKTLPKSTTILPESTTILPESTTVLPESSTVLAESTTVLEESTTILLESTTILPDSTTIKVEDIQA